MDPPGHVHEEDGENEAERDVQAQHEDMPDHPLGLHEDGRMRLTREERRWGLELKQAVQALPDLDELTDFWYAQIALVVGGDLEQGVERVYGLQHYRQEHDIKEELEHAKIMLARYLKRMRGHILHFEYRNREGSYVVVFDFLKFDTRELASDIGREETWAGIYYSNHAFNPDMEAIRQGVIFVVECEGFIWKAPGLLNYNVFRTLVENVALHYPIEHSLIKFCHTGVFVNTLVSAIKQYLPDRVRGKIELGAQTEVRMDTVCMVPNEEVAMQRVLDNMTAALENRYRNESKFKL